jgi:hypothetical protein
MRIIAGILVAVALVGIGIGIGTSVDGNWGPHDAVVVSGGSDATDAGQTIVVADGHYGHGFFFFPFGLLFLALFLFLIFSLFRRGRGGPWKGSGGGPQWLEDWHRRAHEDGSESRSPEAS